MPADPSDADARERLLSAFAGAEGVTGEAVDYQEGVAARRPAYPADAELWTPEDRAEYVACGIEVLHDWEAARRRMNGEQVAAEVGGDVVRAADKTDGSSLIALDWRAFWATEADNDDEWLVEPVIPARRHVGIHAPAKAGKSLIALEMAAGIATGRGVLDQPPGDPHVVLYCDYEMAEADLRERLSDLGYGPESDLGRLVYLLLQPIPPLDTAHGSATFLEYVDRHMPSLVVIDTMSRAVDGEENKSDTLRSWWRYTGRALKERGIGLLRIDHQGKDASAGQRGTSAKNDDLDVVWSMSVNGRAVTLTRTHSRIPWVPDKVALERHTEPLRHVTTQDTWPAGTADCAADLDQLDVALDATSATAVAALKAAGRSRRKDTVLAAQRFRRSRP